MTLYGVGAHCSMTVLHILKVSQGSLLINANNANSNFERQKNFLRPRPKKLSFGTSITSSHLNHYPIYFQ
ncbi:hypothetical protein N7533_011129 [Penicillium manginii]|uniref:uncharacterized protein n=1 Tax=Penicillium manginii TaxID=203109 RepID=UPI002548F3CE|nr:uncharacterized protein N7533_011129 [Penicillium manginii]KAJ5741720.1 hypothetical protein N7533_011129 [Penicillium manginii]